MDPKRAYVSGFLAESLGLAAGEVDASSIPSDLVEKIAAAVKGEADAASEQPALEREIQAYGAELTKSLVETRGFVIQKERWPGGTKYSSCLTHDVDNLSRSLSHIISRRRRFSTVDLLLALLGLRNLYDNISLVSSLEESRRVRSSFYLLCHNYDLRKKSEQLNRLLRRGWDIGLHGDLDTHDSAEKMAEALSKFREATGISPKGVREHFLKFDYNLTWRIMEEAGFAYDSTVGNADRIGFRIGLCTPFHPPDQDWNPIGILELPLTIMDTTLWGYLREGEKEGLRDVERMKQSVAEVNGLFTILWHPEAARMKGGRLYPVILDGLVEDGCFIGSGSDIARWWSSRANSLVLEARTYRMGSAPEGLSLLFKAKGGEKLVVKGGMATEDRGTTTVRALGGPLSVEVL